MFSVDREPPALKDGLMSETCDFIHLHLHSQYSLLDGAVRLPDLIEEVKAQGMPAVAITDHGNMFGAVDFYTRAIAAGIKPGEIAKQIPFLGALIKKPEDMAVVEQGGQPGSRGRSMWR